MDAARAPNAYMPRPRRPANDAAQDLHVLRAPVGGCFATWSIWRRSGRAGHRVGVVVDAVTAARAPKPSWSFSPRLALGITRVPMSRSIGARDLAAIAHVSRRVAQARPDVVHGHGARVAHSARLARSGGAIRPTRPRGSLHYRWVLPRRRLSRAGTSLMRRPSIPVRKRLFARRLPPQGRRSGPRARVVHNGVAPGEFERSKPIPGADLVFVGELRLLKGVDVLIDAIALLAHPGRT